MCGEGVITLLNLARGWHIYLYLCLEWFGLLPNVYWHIVIRLGEFIIIACIGFLRGFALFSE